MSRVSREIEERKKRRIIELLKELMITPDTILEVSPLDILLQSSSDKNLNDFLYTTYRPSRTPVKDELDKERLEDIQKKLNILYNDVQEIKSFLEVREQKKDDAILEFKGKIVDVPEVNNVYCKQTVDGISFWTLFESSDPLETLKHIVDIQVELENNYDNIYFEFLIDPLFDESSLDTSGWIPLYKRR